MGSGMVALRRMWVLALLAACKPRTCDYGGLADTSSDSEVLWTEINALPCALGSDGLVACWSSTGWDPIGVSLTFDAPPPIPVTDITADLDELWGVRADNGLPEVLIRTLDGGFEVPAIPNLAQVANSCALSGTEVLCWSAWDGSPSPLPAEPQYVLLNAVGAHVAALDDQNVLYQTTLTDEDDTVAYPLAAEMEVAEVAWANGGACALDTQGSILCFGPEAGRFEDGPYERLEAHRFTVCGQRARDHVVVCNDGSTFDWGPLRDLVVLDLGAFELQNVGTPDERWEHVPVQAGDPPHVCAITEDNAIRCSGWRYDFPDLQASLPQGDP